MTPTLGGWLATAGAVACAYAIGATDNYPNQTFRLALVRLVAFIANIVLCVEAYDSLRPTDSLWLWATLCFSIPAVIGMWFGPAIHRALGLSRPRPEA